jgi:integrase
MGSIFRKQTTRPVPAGAELVDRIRKPTGEELAADPALREVVEKIARWKDRSGKPRTATVTIAADGSPRINERSATFYAKFRDGEGQVHVVPTGAKTEAGARSVLAELEKRAERVRTGLLTPAESRAADFGRTAIETQLADYRRDMESRMLSPVRIANVAAQLARICRECNFATVASLDGQALARWLADRTAEGMSPGMRNTYRLEAVAFANWLIRTGRRHGSNPFASVPKADAKSNPARKRRALTADELARLLTVARLRPLADLGRATVRIDPPPGKPMKRANWTFAELTFDELEAAAARARERHSGNPALLAAAERTGRERRLIYLTLATTGLRKGELAQLTCGQVSLDSDPPFLTLERGQEKNRQGSTLPLRADVAAELREWLADRAAARQLAASEAAAVRFDPQAARRSNATTGRKRAEPLPPEEPLFEVPSGLLRIMNRDLRTAGIPKRDDRGRTIDVHALRGTFATMLARSGVPMRTAQAVMRHSDPALTANIYTDPRLLDTAAAVEALPSFADPAAASRKSIG